MRPDDWSASLSPLTRNMWISSRGVYNRTQLHQKRRRVYEFPAILHPGANLPQQALQAFALAVADTDRLIPVTNLRTDLCFERCSGSQLVARQANELIHSAD